MPASSSTASSSRREHIHRIAARFAMRRAPFAVAHARQIHRRDVVIARQEGRDEAPPIGMRGVAMHQQQARLRGIAPAQIMDARALDRDETAFRRMARYCRQTSAARAAAIRPAPPAGPDWPADRTCVFRFPAASPGTGGAMGVSDMRARVSSSGPPFNPAAMRLRDGKPAAVDCAARHGATRSGHKSRIAVEFE